MVVVLTQKDDENHEAPVSFMRTNIQGDELNYPSIYKHAYTVYKAVKHFIYYILKNHTKVIVPHPVVRYLFTQQDMGEIRINWMAVVQEFDLDIKHAKIVKGQGLCKFIVEDQDLINVEGFGWKNEFSLWYNKALYVPPWKESWYGTCPENLNPKERRSLKLKSAQYCLINLVLFHVNYDGLLLRCLEDDDVEKVLRELHDGSTGGNFVGETTAHKILRVGYYIPTLFRDAHAYVKKCKYCQIRIGREKREAIPLQPVTITRPFKKWGIDIIWEISPNS